MSMARTILALLVALSVAVTPAVAGSLLSSKASEASVAVIGPLEAMPADCNHHHHSGQAPHDSKPANDRAAMAACAAACAKYVGTVAAAITPMRTASTPLPVATAGLVLVKLGSPPFRPPRV